jgi:hypothetical protein
MTLKQRNDIKERIFKKAAKEGLKVHKNNIHKAKPLAHVCGFMSTKYPTQLANLVSGR